jgi:uncharacterized protein (TIGR02145 family)
MSIKFFLLLSLIFMLHSFGNAQVKNQSIKHVKIGTQIWMEENLNVAHFRNGDLIFHARTDDEWEFAAKAHKPAWCYYDNDPVNGRECGKLYNFYAVIDKRGLAPLGYHVPSMQEVEKLIESTSSNGEGKRWFKDCGSRHLEFEILTSGLDSSVTYKVYSANYFSQLNDWNEYWIQVEPGEESGDNTYGNKFNESDGSPQISITFWESGCGYSVRCIKD